MNNWSTCLTKAQEHFHAADQAFLLKDWVRGIDHLTRSQQWLAEAAKSIFAEVKV